MGKQTNGRALVIGGSMSGLLAGLLLRRHGWDVEVFERVESELSGRGAGIVAQPELIETLRRLGIDPTELGVEITTRKILDAVGPAGRRAPRVRRFSPPGSGSTARCAMRFRRSATIAAAGLRASSRASAR